TGGGAAGRAGLVAVLVPARPGAVGVRAARVAGPLAARPAVDRDPRGPGPGVRVPQRADLREGGPDVDPRDDRPGAGRARRHPRGDGPAPGPALRAGPVRPARRAADPRRAGGGPPDRLPARGGELSMKPALPRWVAAVALL